MLFFRYSVVPIFQLRKCRRMSDCLGKCLSSRNVLQLSRAVYISYGRIISPVENAFYYNYAIFTFLKATFYPGSGIYSTHITFPPDFEVSFHNSPRKRDRGKNRVTISPPKKGVRKGMNGGGGETSSSIGEMKKSDVFHLLPSTPDTHTHSTLHFPGKGRKKLRKKNFLVRERGRRNEKSARRGHHQSFFPNRRLWEIESPNGLWA